MNQKVYIITFHWATNYGAVLQSYALQTFMQDKGFDVKIIDYVPRKLKKSLLKCFMTYKIKKIRKNIDEFLREKKIEKFRKEYLRRSKRYFSNKHLIEEQWEQGVYICGSDQIWNPYFTMNGEGGVTSAYYLQFVPETCQKISYAASFGVTKITEEMQLVVKPWLENFHKISVREKTGVNIIKNLDLRAITVCDPVFLLNRLKYENLITNTVCTDDYVFSYILHENQYNAEMISKYVAEVLKIKWKSNEGGEVGEWLRNIKNTRFLVTNSFHATAFAIIFHVPFVSVLIEGNGMNDRIVTLLEEVDLKERCILLYDEMEIQALVRKDIDWSSVDSKVNSLIVNSKKFLTENI